MSSGYNSQPEIYLQSVYIYLSQFKVLERLTGGTEKSCFKSLFGSHHPDYYQRGVFGLLFLGFLTFIQICSYNTQMLRNILILNLP